MKNYLEKMSESQLAELKAGMASVISETDVVCSAGDGYAIKCCSDNGTKENRKEFVSNELP